MWLTIGLLVPILTYCLQRRPQSASTRRKRKELIQFWAAVGLNLSAGMDFWAAVEESGAERGSVADSIRSVSHAVVQERDPVEAMSRFCQNIPGPEGELIVTMLEHGHHHGVVASDVLAQAQDLEDRFAFEQELKRRQDPLWLTVIPAMLLLNVVVLFATPLAVSMVHSWRGI